MAETIEAMAAVLTADRLKRSFDLYFKAPLRLWRRVVVHGEVIHVQGEQTLKQAGTVEYYLHFVLKGSGGILLKNNRGAVCVDLTFEDEFLTDYLSFIKRESTPFEVQSFETSDFFRISYANFSKVIDSSPLGDKIWRHASEALFMDKQYQQIELLTMTAAERYALILEHHPFVVQRIPQKYIASFLGVTPQSLSRIRNKGRTH